MEYGELNMRRETGDAILNTSDSFDPELELSCSSVEVLLYSNNFDSLRVDKVICYLSSVGVGFACIMGKVHD